MSTDHQDRASEGSRIKLTNVRVFDGHTLSEPATVVPASPPFGGSPHHELELLVDAGLSTIDALCAATVLPARHFGLEDRGTIEPGKRADLVLLSADPIAEISGTRQIERVRCAGVEYHH
jgi:imidazolonepropionase-like amidohydrolase